jgi:hypothetical protein
MAWTDATDALTKFLVDRDLAARQTMLDRIALEDRQRNQARLDAADAREAQEFAQRQADRVVAERAATEAAQAEATKNRLLAMRQASLNVAGTGDPTGAQATRNALAVALRIAGAGKEADAGAAADAATQAGAARTAAIEDYAAAPSAQKAAVLRLAHGVAVPEPPKRDIRTLGDTLIEVTPTGVTTLARAPQKGPSEATQIALDTRRLALEEKQTKIRDAEEAKAAKAEEARTLTADTLAGIRGLLTHPGLDKSQGIIDSRLAALSQDAQDYRGERDRMVAALTLPNLGALKGPMSDKDIVFLKQISSKLANDELSDEATRAELRRLEQFLTSKMAGANAAPQPRRDLGRDW